MTILFESKYLQTPMMEMSNLIEIHLNNRSIHICVSKEHLNQLYEWIKSDKEFVTRFAIISYMCVFLGKGEPTEDDKFIQEIYKVNHHEYYVDMAIAWFIQKLYSINIEKAQKMLDSGKINDFTKKKAISKIKDSLRERKTRG